MDLYSTELRWLYGLHGSGSIIPNHYAISLNCLNLTSGNSIFFTKSTDLSGYNALIRSSEPRLKRGFTA